MATSGENKTTGITVDSTTTQIDSNSKQQAFFAGWLQTRDNSIQPPKESVKKSSCSCHRFEGQGGHGFRCPHHHTNQMSNHNLEEQNRAKSAMSKPQTDKKLNRTASAHCASSTGSTSSNEQSTLQEKSSKNLSSPSTNTKAGEKKSKIPIRFPETTFPSPMINKQVTSGNKVSKIPVPINTHHSLLPKQNTMINNYTSITSDQENRQLFGHE